MSSVFGCRHKPACFLTKRKQWAKLSELLSIPNTSCQEKVVLLMSKASSRSWRCQAGLWTVTMRIETEQEGWFGLGVSPTRGRPTEDIGRQEPKSFCYCWVIMAKAFCFSQFLISSRQNGDESLPFLFTNQQVVGVLPPVPEKAPHDRSVSSGSMRQTRCHPDQNMCVAHCPQNELFSAPSSFLS